MLRAPGIGATRFARLLSRFESADNILTASASDLTAAGVPAQAIAYLQAPDQAQLDNDLAWLAKPGNRLLTLADHDYPQLLRTIDRPPPVLFTHGDVAVLNEIQLAIVGTRKPTPTGQQLAHDFAANLAAQGFVISSGLAQGIDGCAHHGALAAGGRSVAVMATGADRIYPAQHRDLAHQIAKQGVLVSELPPGMPPLAENFPRRNRIISGLSVGTLVIEAAQKSGSLITARLAAEQGREVFALPGSVHNPMVKGCHALIRQGAKLVETADDIIEELGPLTLAAAGVVAGSVVAGSTGQTTIEFSELPQQGAAAGSAEGSTKNSATSSAEGSVASLSAEYNVLLDHMGVDAVAVDTLVERSGLTVDAVSSMLLILELQGRVKTAPGGLYIRLKSRKT